MKAGIYYIGDLCYVLNDEWGEVCKIILPEDGGVLQGEFTLENERKFAQYSTEYGDGIYDSNVQTEHSVDSGSIGCILLKDIKNADLKEIKRLGAIIEFKEDFETSRIDGGTLKFGHITIETSDTSEEFEDEYLL